MTMTSKITGSVCNAVPINQPCKSAVIDQIANVFITAFIIWDIATGNQLIISLSKCQFIPLCFVFIYNLIYQIDKIKAVLSELNFFVLNFRHQTHTPSISANRFALMK